MRLIDRITATLRAVFRNTRVDADLAEEMRDHIERDTAANIRRGMSPDAARRAARMAFGSFDAVHEQARDERPGALAREGVRDFRFGLRLLRKAPAFAIASIVIVALGVGAPTAIFSVVHGVMLRPLPYREPDRLVTIWLAMGEARTRGLPSAADALDLRGLNRVYEGVAFMQNANLTILGDGEPQRLQGAEVSSNLFTLLGTPPSLGRSFAADEDQPGREQVILLSDGLWRGRFGADSSVVGHRISVNGVSRLVVGVMPPTFRYPSAEYEAWIPVLVPPNELSREVRDNYRVVARLRDNVSLELARSETAALANRLANTFASNRDQGMTVDEMLADTIRDVRPALVLVMSAVTFLLFIACVNLANLFGARASARRGEFAVRLALGAPRRRLVVQAIAEAAPVLIVGGVLGIVAAQLALRAFVATAPAGLPRVESIALSLPVVAVSLVVLVLIGIAASIAPAVQAWRSDFTTIAKDGGRSSTSGRARTAARNLGIAAQIALTLPLLVGASLLVRSAINVSRVNLGFVPDAVATMSFEVSRAKHPSDAEVADYYARLVDAARNIPGVTSAGLVNRIPLLGGQTNSVQLEQSTGVTDGEIDSRTVTPDYFKTLGIRLVDGRTFMESDHASSPKVVVVDERLAKVTWPGASALGKRLRLPNDEWATVVGVVAHVRTTSVETDRLPQVYWSYRQWTQNRMVLAVRSDVPPKSLFPTMIAAVRSVDSDQAVYQVRTMPELVDRALAQRRVIMMLVAAFGGVALWLAAAGMYGVVAYGVTQRMREFAIRLALGASPRSITRLVVWQGTSMALLGAAAGLVFAVGTANLMRTLVFGVAPIDGPSIVGATALMVSCAVLASYLPSRRAASADVEQVLRAE